MNSELTNKSNKILKNVSLKKPQKGQLLIVWKYEDWTKGVEQCLCSSSI
jgi:hypothetical protein